MMYVFLRFWEFILHDQCSQGNLLGNAILGKILANCFCIFFKGDYMSDFFQNKDLFIP